MEKVQHKVIIISYSYELQTSHYFEVVYSESLLFRLFNYEVYVYYCNLSLILQSMTLILRTSLSNISINVYT
jgi:hypothetical protein